MASGHVTPHTVLCHHTPCTDNARTVKLRDSVIMALLNCFHMFRTLASLILDRKNRVFFSLERRACLIYAQYIIIADIDDVVLCVRDSSLKKEISVKPVRLCLLWKIQEDIPNKIIRNYPYNSMASKLFGYQHSTKTVSKIVRLPTFFQKLVSKLFGYQHTSKYLLLCSKEERMSYRVETIYSKSDLKD